MTRTMRVLIPAVSLVAGIAVAAIPGGCNRKSPEDTAHVCGAVTFQGKPLSGGLIVFSPDPDRGGEGKPTRADLDDAGRYELNDVPPGWYRISIAAAPTIPTPGTTIGCPFPAKLARPDLAGLVREVKHGDENVFEFAISVPVEKTRN